MREEHKLNKAIQQDGVDTQSDILEDLKRRYPQYVEQSNKKQVPIRRKRVTVISALAAVVACLAIVVPCAVLLPNSDSGGNNDGSGKIRYCTQNEYHKENVDYTIGEYHKNNDLNFLYFDWYELGEDIYTACYTSNVDNEILCIEEQAYLPDKDELIQLSITKANVYLSEFDATISNCKSERPVDNHTVKWGIKGDDAFCIFEDNGYRYFIQIEEGQDENRLFELVAELLETK